MPYKVDFDSRSLLRSLKDTMAAEGGAQERLDQIATLVAQGMHTEVCSIYLFRDKDTLELCATEGLNPEAVHVTRMKVGEGLVGRAAKRNAPVNTANAAQEPGFRYKPETGEEIYAGFCSVPIQRLGKTLGVLVVQAKAARVYSEEEVYALEVVAMVLAEMTELGAFVEEGETLKSRHTSQMMFRGTIGQEGAAAGQVYLHNPRVIITNPVAEDPQEELTRLHDALKDLRLSVDKTLGQLPGDSEQMEIFSAYRMFLDSRGWIKRMEDDIVIGLSAEAAVEKEQSYAQARMAQVTDPYLKGRLTDLDDLSNRLMQRLTGQAKDTYTDLPPNAILVARTIGPGELLEYGKRIKGIILQEGAVGSHAAIVARAWAIPLVLNVSDITREAVSGDPILVDGDQGVIHLRPDEIIQKAFNDKLAMQAKAQERYVSIRDKPARTLCGTYINLHMNAGLIADLPSLEGSGAEGVGLFRTELQFLARARVPKRGEVAALYARVMDAAKGKRVVFRTLDIGSDKVLPYTKPQDEPNPALGWRAIRVGLEKRGVLRMQLQALLRAANGRPLTVMFPFIAQLEEFVQAREALLTEVHRERSLGHSVPEKLEIGAMLETPSMVFAPRRFFELADFVSIGGNDLKQFFFAADRENERVRRRYDTLNVSFLSCIEQIVQRCTETDTPLSFCGEDAGRPVEAVCLAAMGLRALSMRPASIGPVKNLIRKIDLDEARTVIDAARASGAMSVRPAVMDWLRRDWVV